MPAILAPQQFEFETDQPVPDHVEGHIWHRTDLAADKYHIEAFDLESGGTEMIAVDLETVEDAAVLMIGAIEKTRRSSGMGPGAEGMTNMRGFAIVGPNSEGKGDAQNVVGIGWRLAHGYELPRRTLDVLARIPEAAPRLLEYCGVAGEPAN